MTDVRQESRYCVLRFPEDFPLEWRQDVDGRWIPRSVLTPLGRYYWVSEREEGKPEYLFCGTGQFEFRDDGKLAEVFMLAWPEVRQWGNTRLLSVSQLQATAQPPMVYLWDEFQRLYKDLMDQVGERTIIRGPTLQLRIELEAEEPKNLPKDTHGRAEPNQG